MSKAKRISLIAKGKSVLSDLIGIKERKIRRAVDTAIDKAQEAAITANEAALKCIEDMSQVDTAEHYNQCINKYFEHRSDVEEWRRRQTWATELKALLDEEIEVPKEEKQ